MLTISGLAEAIAALEAAQSRVEVATPHAVRAGQALIEGQARANLSRYSHQRGTPTPSPPGEPPALITGRLRSSFDLAGPTPAGAGVWMSMLGPTAPYARVQELGGSTGRTTLPARPYLRPAVEALRNSGLLADVFARAWETAIFSS